MDYRGPILLRFHSIRSTISLTLSSCLIFLSIAALTLAPSTSQAQQLTQYAHTAWRFQEGVFDAAPISIAQTADGFLWIGTLNGLFRFDGVHFDSWNDRIHELHTCCALSLLGATDGSLWIGTSVGLARLKDGKVVAVTDHDARYNAMVEDRNGRIWGARTRIRDDKGPLCEVKGTDVQCHGEKDGLGCQFGNVVTQDKSGTVWVGDVGKICSWHDGKAVAYSARIADAGCKPIIQSLLVDPTGLILIGCEGGLRRLERGTLVPFRPGSLDPDHLEGSQLLYDHGGGLWIGTASHGLYRVSDGVADHFGVEDGLSDDNVSALYEDREGNIWVATPNGIDRFHRLNVISFSSKQGLRATGGSAVLATRDGHTLWTSSPQGLAVLRDGKITVMTRKEGLPGEQVTALLEDRHGVLWLGIDRELFSYANGHFTKHLRSDGKPTDMVVAMAEDANGYIWTVTIGAYRLLRMDPKTGIAEVIPTSVTPSRITSSPHGVVYLLSFLSGQISVGRNGNDWETIPLPTGPRTGRSLLAYDEDSLFVATDAGLYRWKDRKWSALTTKNGLPCGTVQDLVNDAQAGLWVHLSCGFVYISKGDLDAWSRDDNTRLNIKLYDTLDGARPGRGDFEPGRARTANGQLWFANGSVLQMIDPNNLVHNDLPPPVSILKMVADHKIISSSSNYRLPPLTRDLEIHYAALSLVSPEKVRFRYALWGADKNWQEVGSRREAYYMNLRPGRYRFQVIASNNDGVWNQQGATLDFSIAPAYYQTNWFRALCAALLLALLWAAHQLRVRQLAAQFNVRLEERVAERTRIARDLHDTLLQSFHGLLLRFQAGINLLPGRPTEARKVLEDAVEHASRAITEGRDAISCLRMSTVENNDLALAIRTIGEELGSVEGNQPTPRFEVVVEGTSRNLHPILRDEVYRLATEALRNAFRHAAARTVEVEIHYDDKNFRLRIRDDGKGIDSEVLRADGRQGHYGLHGMRERAELVGGKLTIWTELDSGTEIELIIPGARAYVKSSRPFWYFGKRTATETDEKETIERE